MAHTELNAGSSFSGQSARSRRRRRKMKPIYQFVPYKLTKVKPQGSKSPKPRSGHRIVADNSNIYCFGGYNPQSRVPEGDIDDFILMHSCMLFKELWKFNFASQEWRKLRTSGTMPEELASHAAVLIGNHMLVFGGTSVPFGVSTSNSVHVCNLKALEWSQMETTGEPPPQQYGQAMAVDQGKLYVVGGTTGFEYSMSVHCLDLKSKEWSEMCATTHPEPRYRHEIAVDDNKLYVFGGGTSSLSFGLKEIPVFNLRDQLWEKVVTSEEHPAARLCHGCVKIDDDIVISGGHDSRSIFPDIWSFNMKSFLWRKLPCTLPEPVYFHSAAVSPEGQMFLFGGVTNAELNTRTNALYSVWLKVPSLMEMCWQAVLFYVPHISRLNDEDLLMAGIPKKYLDRIDFTSTS